MRVDYKLGYMAAMSDFIALIESMDEFQLPLKTREQIINYCMVNVKEKPDAND